ncbi:MAG: hypothetical protein DI563_01860 [Variovorax paradoxus]|uniref:Uncharacterized protein n=1 Tax=Variovorax paradoxus TaxID=34073 RepID=A0A2W5S5A3_VARPD|nr:MAG: hypothetical protein DI563_01860 [Variovorax paradoxus]
MTAILKLFPSWAWLVLGGAVLASVFAFGWRQGGASAREKLADYKLNTEYQAETQRQANRSRSQSAEQAQAQREPARTVYITKTIERVRDATAPLASCALPDAAIRVLNDARECARQGRSPSCAPDHAVPGS